jgi:hypothetical protein
MLLPQQSHGAALLNATVAIERLREFLPDAETASEAVLREELPAEYTGKSSLLLVADERYYFFQWSETGPVTRNSDTGRWLIRDGFVELESAASNVVIKDAPVRFLAVKFASYRYRQWFLIEVSQQFERLLAAEADLRSAKGDEAARRSEFGPSPAQNLLESTFSLRGGALREILAAQAEVAEAQNRDARAWPVSTSPLADFIVRAKRFIPEITAPLIRRRADVAGEYVYSWGVGAEIFYLLPDGGYYYRHASDFDLFFPTYHYGTWVVQDNVVELTDTRPGKSEYGPLLETRFFVVRAPATNRAGKRESQRLQLVGTSRVANSFLIFAPLLEGAVLADQRSGRPPPIKLSYRNLHALAFESAISARRGSSLRRQFDFANLQAATDRRLTEEFKLRSSQGDYGDKNKFISTVDCHLTVDGMHFSCDRVEGDIGPTTLKLSGAVRAEADGSVRTLPTTTLYLDGTKITGASPAFEVGGRTVAAPAR